MSVWITLCEDMSIHVVFTAIPADHTRR